MITLYPQVYDNFTCLAASCQKTCCQRWEIDIDEETASQYLQEKGDLGDELRQWVVKGLDGYHFSFEDTGYCHFWREDGFCRLVLEKGEDYLCDICHNHPRFYKYIGDLELCGVGLACEATVRLLKGESLQSPNATIRELEEGVSPSAIFLEGDLLFREYIDSETQELLATDGLDVEARSSVTLYDILCDLGLILPSDVTQWNVSLIKSQTSALQDILTWLGPTEALSEEWTSLLEEMQKNSDQYDAILHSYVGSHAYDHLVWNRLYQYILYRQIDMLEEGFSLACLVEYAWRNTFFILAQVAWGEDFVKAVVDWSEQIEYNLDNVSLLFQSIQVGA